VPADAGGSAQPRAVSRPDTVRPVPGLDRLLKVQRADKSDRRRPPSSQRTAVGAAITHKRGACELASKMQTAISEWPPRWRSQRQRREVRAGTSQCEIQFSRAVPRFRAPVRVAS